MMMMMLMTMTTAMIMTTPTQADGDRAQTVGHHRQTYSGTAGQTHTEQRDISEKATTAHAVRVGNRVVGRGGMGGRSHHMWQSRNVVPLPTLTHTLAHTYCILCGRVRAWHTRQSDAVGAHVELTATR